MKNEIFETKQRRSFLKTSAILTGGALLSGIPLAGAYASGSDVIKIALIGSGSRGTGAAFQALSTKFNLKLVAMADAFPDKLDKSYQALLTKFGAEKISVPDDKKFVGFEGYIAAMQDADVVMLCTPPGFRPAHFAEAVKQNKQIFMEKPVATDSPGIRSVLATAEEAKRKKLNVVVGLQRHYQKNYREIIDRVHQGGIGDVLSGQVYWNSGGVWVNPRQPNQTEMEYQMRNWYYFNWLCGDHIVEQHVHNIDVANWVKNKYPVSAYGAGGRFLRTGKDYGEIYDSHSVEFVYDDGSVISSQCRHYTGGANRIDESFQGTKGKIYLDSSNKGNIWDHKGKVLLNYEGKGDANPYQTEHDELFAAITANQFKFSDAENAAKSTMTAILGRYASYSGNVVKWDEALNSEISLMPKRLAWDALPKVLPNFDGTYPYAIPGITKVV
ncbi:MAG: Gfo/Idh/MocA family oxidoreductase [Daejeonella sp.]|uniref:Gfo/Idh/MocA family protein n=1 Tax=Daejeonella sp. TaxID=2805397 RepID=UPI002732DEE5|nr:Gfo/Idh/MocA family oxidoreductase [Daejeonella sp.]MDP3468625.1 Gfo/Idh/MocA family oxidoreductase [Daejeonella sp.]